MRLLVALTTIAVAACSSSAPAPAPLALLDEADSIGKWTGLKAVVEPVQSGKASAAWRGAGTGGMAKLEPAPTDWSKHNVLAFDLHSSTPKERHIIVVAVSTKDVEKWSYYIHRVRIDWEGWRTVRLPFAKFGHARTPNGWNAIDSLCFYSRGWDIEPLKGSVIHLDNVRLEYSPKLARRTQPRRKRTPSPKFEPWQGKLAFPPLPVGRRVRVCRQGQGGRHAAAAHGRVRGKVPHDAHRYAQVQARRHPRA